jgi:hypothetical protein
VGALNRELLVTALRVYTKTIYDFDRMLMRHFHLDEHPYQDKSRFANKGVLSTEAGSFEYWFHGGGCSLTFDSGLEVHYDYLITEADYITTSPWKFMRFLATWPDTRDTPDPDPTFVAALLAGLERTGAVRKVYPDYLVYQIVLDQIIEPSV